MAKTKSEKAEGLSDETIKTSGEIDDIIKAVTADIKKEYPTAQNQTDQVLEFLDTGNLAINYAISGKADGGFPVGRCSEIYGENSCVTGDTLVEVIIEE